MCRVHNDEDLMVVTDGGTIMRLPVHEISVYSRQAKGVRVITPAKKQQVVSIHPVVASGPDDEVEPEEGETLLEGAEGAVDGVTLETEGQDVSAEAEVVEMESSDEPAADEATEEDATDGDATEGDVDEGCLPRHQGRQRSGFVNVDVWMEAQAALQGTTGRIVLHAVPEEDLDLAA